MPRTPTADDGWNPPPKLKGWGFNAQTLINFARTMTAAEKDELVDALWPAIERRMKAEAPVRREDYVFLDENGNPA